MVWWCRPAKYSFTCSLYIHVNVHVHVVYILLKKSWDKICSQPHILRRYFTKTGCGMTASGEDDDLISPQRFKKGTYSFEYTPHAPAQLQPIPENGEEEPDAPEGDEVEALGDAMIAGLEHEQGELVDEDEAGHLDEEAYEMSDALENNKSSKEYVYVKAPEDGPSSLPPGITIVHLFTTGWERGAVHSLKKGSKQQKNAAKNMDEPVYVRYVIDKEYYLHDLGSEDAIYISEEVFDQLASGESKEADENISPGAWCIVKLE